MHSDWQAVLALLDDLEMQAEGLHLAERAAEVEALSVAGYAEVAMVGRLHASLGREVHAVLADDLELRGRLARVGSDWLLVEQGHAAWFARLPALRTVTGLDDGAVPEEARPLSARLSLGSVLRRVAEERSGCALHLLGGRVVEGRLVRVGADFVELRSGEPADTVVVPLAAVVVLRPAEQPR